MARGRERSDCLECNLRLTEAPMTNSTPSTTSTTHPHPRYDLFPPRTHSLSLRTNIPKQADRSLAHVPPPSRFTTPSRHPAETALYQRHHHHQFDTRRKGTYFYVLSFSVYTLASMNIACIFDQLYSRLD